MAPCFGVNAYNGNAEVPTGSITPPYAALLVCRWMCPTVQPPMLQVAVDSIPAGVFALSGSYYALGGLILEQP
ncbi:MAG TPA: hypothetical protein VGF59_23805 [Bryobacteraceae bacterium]